MTHRLGVDRDFYLIVSSSIPCQYTLFETNITILAQINTNHTIDICDCTTDDESNKHSILSFISNVKLSAHSFIFIIKMEMNEIDWDEFEKFIGERIPPCIKTVLNLCGFNTFISIAEINNHSIIGIEEFVSSHFATQIAQLECCHAAYYKSQMSRGQFKFLPGHELLVLVLPKYVERFRAAYINEVLSTKFKKTTIVR